LANKTTFDGANPRNRMINNAVSTDRIKLLNRDTIEKIAAGEVIERPASVVKELIENSIDAQARDISLFLRKGGTEMIRITDDGCGVSKEDLLLTITRHATSKISSVSDIYRIKSLGFRGEALASISAVSNFSLETSQGNEAVKLEVAGGSTPEISDHSHQKGTTITVGDIFYNTPVRKKFLKSERSELNKILHTIDEIALANPQTAFRVYHDNRELQNLPATEIHRDRLFGLWGKDTAGQCLEVKGSVPGLHIRGFLGHPQIARNNRSYQYLFVNGRAIVHRGLQTAVKRGCGTMLPHDRFAVFALFLDIDPQEIDIHVHPTKREIKFSDERRIFSFIYSQVTRAFQDSNFALAKYRDMGKSPESAVTTEPVLTDMFSQVPETVRKTDPNRVYPSPGGENTFFSSVDGTVRDAASQQPYMPASSDGPTAENNTAGSHQEAEPSVTYFQLHKLYIVSQIKNGLLMIDQHAAHERILYEKAAAELNRPAGVSQQLLFPVVIELRVAEFQVIETTLDYFSKLGFDIKPFSGTSIAVAGVPPLVSVNAVEQTIRDMVRYLIDSSDVKIPLYDRMAKSFACGASVRAGQTLSQEEMASLVDTLFSSESPYTCPHGRPTVLRISTDEIAKRFLRT